MDYITEIFFTKKKGENNFLSHKLFPGRMEEQIIHVLTKGVKDMGFIKWANSLVDEFDYFDMVLIKLATVAFTLMVARLWEPLLNLNWYWYGILFLILIIRPWTRVVSFISNKDNYEEK